MFYAPEGYSIDEKEAFQRILSNRVVIQHVEGRGWSKLTLNAEQVDNPFQQEESYSHVDDYGGS